MRYYTGGSEQNEETYMCRHPGGYLEMANWIADMEFKWTGMDCGSGDHPMNTSIRDRRPDIRKDFEKKWGKSVDEAFPEEHLFCMHRIPFPKNIIHVENVGGDLDKVGTTRCKIGCFPWRFEGGEAAMCRVVAWID
jgi:arylformamidase